LPDPAAGAHEHHHRLIRGGAVPRFPALARPAPGAGFRGAGARLLVRAPAASGRPRRRLDARAARRCGQRRTAWPARARLFAARVSRSLAFAAYPLVRSDAAVVARGAHAARGADRGAVRAPRRQRSVPGLADLYRAAPRRGTVAGGDLAAVAAAAAAAERAGDLNAR